jgi:hypothetical protein
LQAAFGVKAEVASVAKVDTPSSRSLLFAVKDVVRPRAEVGNRPSTLEGDPPLSRGRLRVEGTVVRGSRSEVHAKAGGSGLDRVGWEKLFAESLSSQLGDAVSEARHRGWARVEQA